MLLIALKSYLYYQLRKPVDKEELLERLELRLVNAIDNKQIDRARYLELAIKLFKENNHDNHSPHLLHNSISVL